MAHSDTSSENIESRKDFEDDAGGQYRYWLAELTSSETRLKKWHKKGVLIVERFTGGGKKGEGADDRTFNLNIFHSNITTLICMLYGNLPKVDVSRKYTDAQDDIARVAANILERLLNIDIQDNGHSYDAILRSTLQDRLLPGLGCARVRYTEPKGDEPEAAPLDYYNWQDVLWSWGRNNDALTWKAYRSYLTKDKVEARFGADAANGVTLKKQSPLAVDDEAHGSDRESVDAWSKAEVWEIWDKTKRQVVWVSKGYDKVLDTKDDFLALKGFFPSPPFFIANATTAEYKPTPDYVLAQDLYNEINVLQTRISIITEAVKVVGVCDNSAEDVKRMLDENVDNELIPIDKWATFAEKGGLAGQIEWMPVKDIVEALDKLIQLRDQSIALLQQITGMADIMRGALDNQYEGVGQSKLKATFGSIRIQHLQDEFATFAGGLMQLKAEVIMLHFDPKTIVQKANMQFSPDKEIVPQAVALLKEPLSRFRVTIRPESVAMTDFAQLKSERVEFLDALSKFLGAAGPLMQSNPEVSPFMLQMLQWTMAGFKGSSEIEGVLDKAVAAATEAAKNPPPDAEKQKADAEMQKIMAEAQNELKAIAAKAQADQTTRDMDMRADINTARQQAEIDLAKIAAEGRADLMEIDAKAQASIDGEATSSAINIEQQHAAVDAEVEKETIKLDLKLTELAAVHENKMDEIAAAKTEPEERDDDD